jgi:hypothetical protein
MCYRARKCLGNEPPRGFYPPGLGVTIPLVCHPSQPITWHADKSFYVCSRLRFTRMQIEQKPVLAEFDRIHFSDSHPVCRRTRSQHGRSS